MPYEFIQWPNVAVPTYGDDGEGGIRQGANVIVAGSDPGGIPEYDGEGNIVGSEPWWYLSAGQTLSYNEWAYGKMLSTFGTGNPNNYDWIILGEYAMAMEGFTAENRRAWIFDNLRIAGAAAGMPADYDWTDCLAYAARLHWDQFGQPFRWLDTPAAAPLHGALSCASAQYPALATFVEQTGPGSELWNVTVAAAAARRSAHNDVVSGIKKMAWMAVLTMGVATYLAPAAGASSASAGSAGATATTSGAELAAMVEAGSVGFEGAFLEAAALTGSTVTYSTATGAILSATTPAGATIAFDAGADAFAQFGVDPSSQVIGETVAPSQVASDAPATQTTQTTQTPPNTSTTQTPPATQSTGQNLVQKAMDELGITEILGPDAAASVASKLAAMGQSALAAEVRDMFAGDAPAPSAPRAAQTGPLQTAGTGGSLLGAANPLLLGAGLAGLLLLAWPEEDKPKRKSR